MKHITQIVLALILWAGILEVTYSANNEEVTKQIEILFPLILQEKGEQFRKECNSTVPYLDQCVTTKAILELCKFQSKETDLISEQEHKIWVEGCLMGHKDMAAMSELAGLMPSDMVEAETEIIKKDTEIIEKEIEIIRLKNIPPEIIYVTTSGSDFSISRSDIESIVEDIIEDCSFYVSEDSVSIDEADLGNWHDHDVSVRISC